MEKKNNIFNNNNQDNKINKKKTLSSNLIQIKSQTNNYKANNNGSLTKKAETHFYSKINNQIDKPKKYNRQEIIENNIKKPSKLKEKEKIIFSNSPINISEIKSNNNRLDNRIKNIKVNKINFDKNVTHHKTNFISNSNNTNINYQQINTIYLTKPESINFSNNNCFPRHTLCSMPLVFFASKSYSMSYICTFWYFCNINIIPCSPCTK